ncbi:MAG: hypothetical protein Q4E18_04145 [Clostridia bacterium]|nr:hypothetical protein [Clostridia bacterium]
METKVWRYGCLFCRTGTEVSVADSINQRMSSVEAIAPVRVRRKTVAGKVLEDQAPLLPGYIFFRTETVERLPQMTRISDVLKLLEYDDLSWELMGSDREFAEFLFGNALFRPRVSFIDGRLHFEEGFLYGHDDAVVRVNRRKKTAEIRLEIDRLAFWIGYDEQ